MISKITLCYRDPEGFIGNVEEFRKEDITIRLDVLQDWIYALEEEYERTMKEALGEA